MPYITYQHTQNKRIQKAKQEQVPNTYLYLHHHASKCTDSKLKFHTDLVKVEFAL